MAVKIRLMRLGAKKKPFYRIIVVDSRKPRDGAYKELLGYYDPMKSPSEIKIDTERAREWLEKGAQPSERVIKILSIAGVWDQFKDEKDARIRLKNKRRSEKRKATAAGGELST